MRGLEYLDDDWQDEVSSFERIKHRPKAVKGIDEQSQKRRQEGRIRRESQKVHESKYTR
jgi:hypothetical protein